MIGYVSGNDVVVISGQDAGYGSSPLPCSSYAPPPAPKKAHACVNRAANDLGFQGELDRMERCSSRDSEQSMTGRNRSWHDILSQSEDEDISDRNRVVKSHASREGSLELYASGAGKPKAIIKDVDTIVIETQNGRSTTDSGIGTHQDQSDAGGVLTRTNSQGSHYSLDLHSFHSDPETVDDGISLSTGDTGRIHHSKGSDNNQQNNPITNSTHHRIEITRHGHAAKSVPKRHMVYNEDDEEEAAEYIPPLKLNFDVDDDELEESYCRSVESEKRDAAAVKKQLHVHHDSAFTKIAAESKQHQPQFDHVFATERVGISKNVPQVSASNSVESSAGTKFSPIQPFPITPRDYHVVTIPTINSNQQPNQTTTTSKTDSTEVQQDSHQYQAYSHRNENRNSEIHHGTTESASMSHMHQLQNHLMMSHEEQLSQMTALCKQEMKLLMSVKTSNQDFTAYVKGLEEILSDKGRCILHLKAQIDDYLNATEHRN